MSITADQLWQLPPTPEPVAAAAATMWRNVFGAVKRRDVTLLSDAARYLNTGDLLGHGVISLAGHAADLDYPQLAAAASTAATWHRSTGTPNGGRSGVDVGRALRIAAYRSGQLEQATRLMRPLLAAVDDPTVIRPPLIRVTAILRSAGVAPSWTLLAQHLAAAANGHADQVRLLWSRSFHTAPAAANTAAAAEFDDTTDPSATPITSQES